jgi:hypothetical protein
MNTQPLNPRLCYACSPPPPILFATKKNQYHADYYAAAPKPSDAMLDASMKMKIESTTIRICIQGKARQGSSSSRNGSSHAHATLPSVLYSTTQYHMLQSIYQYIHPSIHHPADAALPSTLPSAPCSPTANHSPCRRLVIGGPRQTSSSAPNLLATGPGHDVSLGIPNLLAALHQKRAVCNVIYLITHFTDLSSPNAWVATEDDTGTILYYTIMYSVLFCTV